MTGKNRQRSASAAAEGQSADAIGAVAAAASNDRRPSGASGGGSTDNLADINGGALSE